MVPSAHSAPMRALKLSLFALAIAACKAPAPEIETRAGDIASVAAHLACLPDGASLTVAHRGTQRGSAFPENSLSALDALVAAGIRMAEIDVAQTSDGTHILFHDDAWDADSTGQGAVAETRWSRAMNFQLRDTQGRPSSDVAPTLTEYLREARGRILIEIDFKRSADYDDVIAAIRNAGMSDHVVLIAYTIGQARKLRRLAPRMHISLPEEDYAEISGPKLAWLGETTNGARDYPTIAKPPEGRATTATLHVTNSPMDWESVQNLADPAAFAACLAGT